MCTYDLTLQNIYIDIRIVRVKNLTQVLGA
jgi:hypothetical protein